MAVTSFEVLEIKRLGWLRPRYAVSDDRGQGGIWVRRRYKEAMTGEVNGHAYELQPDGRRRFSLIGSGQVLVTAEASRRGRWVISAGDSA